MDSPTRSRGVICPSFADLFALVASKGAGKAGRRLAPEVPRVRKERARGGRQVMPVARPSLRDGFHGVLRTLLGERCTIAPVALRMCDARAGWPPHLRQDLTPEPRASGPHDFSVRAHPRWVLHGWRALAAKTMRRRYQRRVVSRLPLLTVSRPASHHRAPTPSRPPHPGPRLVTIAKRPLWRAGWRDTYDKTEFL